MNRIILADAFDPWRNLAVEENLFDTQGAGVTLYLWQNRNTVVIGRHQNAWKECRYELLEADGGRLARRTTGGGAVFHDLGNLNFTFVADKASYDLARQLKMVTDAVNSLGIAARFTGRNDIIAEGGAKFSGNAFRHSYVTSLHHGTLLVSADMSLLSKYLVPSAEKLKSKGVDSVRARVCNLSELNPRVTVDAMRDALISAFAREYGEYATVPVDALDAAEIEALTEKHASYDWRVGASPACDIRLETRFPWGGLELLLTVKNGSVCAVDAYSDAMDESYITSLKSALAGVRATRGALGDAALRADCRDASILRDVADWLSNSIM